ncbi:MAG: GTP-binding protein [Candidatus Cloacimonadota bacterium]|nr:MAG: GTP-binding protein [Candidatus Cloacimonadota bacterium]
MKILNAQYIKSCMNINDFPSANISEITFVGRSNVGKSSIINVLLNRKDIARISKQPGKTRKINLFNIIYRDEYDKEYNIYFTDLPGYGFAKVPQIMLNKWKKLIENYITKRENLVGIVVIIDVRHKVDIKDYELVQWLKFLGREFILVGTKCDKINKSQYRKRVQYFVKEFSIKEDEIILFSAKNKFGRLNVWDWINSQREKFFIPNSQT